LIGFDRQGRLIVRDRFPPLVDQGITVAPLIERVEIIGIDLDRLAVVRKRVIILVVASLGESAPNVRLFVLWIHLDRLVVVGFDLQDLLVALNRLLELTLIEVGDADIVVCHPRPRVFFNGRFKLMDHVAAIEMTLLPGECRQHADK
jgi:hypothetical protein